MILKSLNKVAIKKNSKKNKFLISYFIITSLIGIILLLFFFTSYAFKNKALKVLDYLSKAGRFEYIYIFDIAYNAIKSNFYKLDKIDIEIKFDDVLTLEKEREQAIKNKTLGLKDDLTKVNVLVKYKGKNIKSRIRLKGGRLMHFNKKKHSSYNVYLEKNKYIYGTKNFSVHKPGVRNYIHEWIFNEMMGDLGLIKPKYEFFELFINGSSNGLYAFEEKMGKEILERNKRKNGPIISTLAEYNRDTYIDKKKLSNNDPLFQVYDNKYWYQPENINLAKTAIKKITEFYNGERSSENTFDLDKMAAFFAVLDATYTTHALFFNSKLYYNPSSGLFEPVPRDGHRQLPNYHKFNNNYYKKTILDSIYTPETFEELGNNLQINKGRQWWINKFFLNKNGEINREFYKLYIKYLTKVSSEKYLKSFFDLRNSEIKRINSHIYSDYFFYSWSRGYTWGLYYFDKDDLFYRGEVIRNRLKTENKVFSAIIDSNKNLVIDVAYGTYNNTILSPLKFDDLNIHSINCKVEDNDQITLINKPLNVFTNTKVRLNYNFDQKKICNNVIIKDNKLNQNYLVKIDEFNSFHTIDEFKENIENNYLNYFRQNNKNLYLINDIAKITENLSIPSNLKVIINPGQKLILLNNSFIISNSPWFVDGTKKEIIISGLESNLGGGLMIRNSLEKSYFNNVKFSYLSGYLYNDEMIISGAVNFYKTDLLLKDVIIEKTISEDALNIVNSKFYIKNIKFFDSKSDSIDLDFSSGSMDEAKFSNIGNDAIDLSGSIVNLTNVNFDKVADKIISVGENSKIKISNINAQQSYVGIASKDGSIVNASNINMKNVKLPFLSFNKKFEYEPANMYLSNINITEYEQKWLTDKLSKIYHNNSQVGKLSKNIIPIVYDKNLELLQKIN
jgi:hypothetical protein